MFFFSVSANPLAVAATSSSSFKSAAAPPVRRFLSAAVALVACPFALPTFPLLPVLWWRRRNGINREKKLFFVEFLCGTSQQHFPFSASCCWGWLLWFKKFPLGAPPFPLQQLYSRHSPPSIRLFSGQLLSTDCWWWGSRATLLLSVSDDTGMVIKGQDWARMSSEDIGGQFVHRDGRIDELGTALLQLFTSCRRFRWTLGATGGERNNDKWGEQAGGV